MNLMDWLWRRFDKPSPARREQRARHRQPFDRRIETDPTAPPPPVVRLRPRDEGNGLTWNDDDD